jgi:hypothetical protein
MYLANTYLGGPKLVRRAGPAGPACANNAPGQTVRHPSCLASRHPSPAAPVVLEPLKNASAVLQPPQSLHIYTSQALVRPNFDFL